MLESIIDIVRRAGELVRSANDVTAAPMRRTARRIW